MTRFRPLRQSRSTPLVEPLEGRPLLSLYTGPSTVYPVLTHGALYQLTVSGGGFEKVREMGHGQVRVILFGTTASSTLTVNLLRGRPHFPLAPLEIGNIIVRSGELGKIDGLSSADLEGPITPISGVNSLSFAEIGPKASINVLGSLGSLTAGGVNLGPNGSISVSGDVTGAINIGGAVLNGGKLSIGNDATGPISASSLTIEHSGLLSVGRDATAGISINNDLTLDSGGNVSIGRNFGGLTVNGDLVVTPTGGSVNVGGNFDGLTVTGVVQGNGTSRPDVFAGLDLNGLKILGGQPNAGGLQHASIVVGKNINGFDVSHGVFNSFISAGVLIDGKSGPSLSPNISPDGNTAVFDSNIRAGIEIKNFLINGDVVSDYPTNPQPTGYRTRIVAGEDAAGNFTAGGSISNFQITGELVDSVLAASVQPFGGNGTLPVTGYGAPLPIPGTTPGDGGANTYDQPAGVMVGGTVGTPISYPNYSEVSYYNEKPTGVAYNPADPTIDDDILPGSINAGFASTPLPDSSLTSPTTVLPLPTTSTVLGGVISTPHGDNQDYAGIFAADTSGVFVGQIPTKTG